MALALGLSASRAMAGITLQDLLDGDELVCGDKVFENFTFQPTALAGDRINQEKREISVDCEEDGNDVTVSLQGFWESVFREISDTLLGFDVYVTDPFYSITGVTLSAPGMRRNRQGDCAN